MSVFKSYFNRNNTIIYNSYSNTGRNPVVELFFGRVDNVLTPLGYSRFIFDIDLAKLQQKITDGLISTGCSKNMTHTLRMTNTSSFDKELLNDKWSNGRRRATSFDLVLFRIPNTSGSTGNPQLWDEGVGYDYYDFNQDIPTNKSFSERPSNWYEAQTISNWSYNGIYDNQNNQQISGLNFSGLTIVDTQHFEFGNEDIEFDMTNEINNILTGSTTGVTGWGIAFYPEVENITGLTENYSVGFFSRHTQTFYEPYLETTYDDLIEDDRNIFYEKKSNKLYLYSYSFGNPQNFDSLPTVDILDLNGDVVPGFSGLTTCLVTNGVYEVTVSGLTGSSVPCIYYDNWKGLSINGVTIDDVENEFVVNNLSNLYQIGSTTNEPSLYGFDYYGIKQDEKILGNDVRKVGVIIKKAYTTNQVLSKVDAYYRVYVREGKTEVQVQDWTKINRTPDGHYFIFTTEDKIPNEYFIDMKVITDREINTYKRTLKFQIVNRK
jgi:hypothetical protein